VATQVVLSVFYCHVSIRQTHLNEQNDIREHNDIAQQLDADIIRELGVAIQKHNPYSDYFFMAHEQARGEEAELLLAAW
jgi:hypothetical protein